MIFTLSSLLVPGYWLSPDDLTNENLLDYELGGIGLNDPSQGLRFQTWTLRYIDPDVIVSAPAYPETVLFSRSNITQLGLAFDQNMNPFVCFVESGAAKFWWYDTSVSMQVFTSLPAGSITPVCCMDDKRETQTTTNDICIAYLRDNNLYTRFERERYITEHLEQAGVYNPSSGLPARLKKVGMTDQNRLQFLLQSDLPKGYLC